MMLSKIMSCCIIAAPVIASSNEGGVRRVPKQSASVSVNGQGRVNDEHEGVRNQKAHQLEVENKDGTPELSVSLIHSTPSLPASTGHLSSNGGLAEGSNTSKGSIVGVPYCSDDYCPIGKNQNPPQGYVPKPGSGPCSCKGFFIGLESCGHLCCAASPYTDPDPKGQYYYRFGLSHNGVFANDRVWEDVSCYEKLIAKTTTSTTTASPSVATAPTVASDDDVTTANKPAPKNGLGLQELLGLVASIGAACCLVACGVGSAYYCPSFYTSRLQAQSPEHPQQESAERLRGASTRATRGGDGF